MESPALMPTSGSSEKGENEKEINTETQNSNKGKQLSQPVKILPSSSSVANPSSGTTAADSKIPPSSTKSPPTVETNDATSPPAVDTIDSALLAALRDSRERLGLLKLEQILIDFLEKQPQDSYVDIGGPYNSTVVSPTLGYIGQQPQQLQAMAQAQPDGTNAGRPQTTFQRCILHRICDRFNMTRENSYKTDAYGCYLIRVCKGPDSKKPTRRLLNVKESEYQIPRPPDNSNGNAGVNPNHQLSANFQQMNLSASGTTTPTGGNGPSGGKGGRKVGKMKIMKRSSSNISNSSSGSNNSKSKNNVTAIKTRSTLSEKERKYAEARARIFEQEEASKTGSGDQTAESSQSYAVGTSSAPVSGNYYNNNNKNNVTNEGYGGYNNSERRGGYNSYNYNYNMSSYNPSHPSTQSASTSSSTPGSATGNPKAPPHNNSVTSLNSMSSNNSGKGSNSDGDQQQSTNTTRSKATYRNRQQEETDPDFRRGAGIQLQTNQYAHAHNTMYTAGGRGGGNVYYPNNVVTANGNNSRVGYGYGQQQQQQQQLQQHYSYHQQQQHYSTQQQHQTPYYPTNTNAVGGRGYAHSNMQYQQQRRHHEQHYPALSSSTARK
eukprot:CAMPEP_0116128080 /NCGR_PEP_ID=MMETSP0329-20121206/7172_1 /TAXON_ID=697910 /ORGANISM="Pseudo-nitzschia arenysensis, Strain B593" /LENGTH=604 /DNA_ID=CAMNT_0003622201 /DNA_START=156 /DNA_END=1970 /DNA_ORIENTATION=+